MSRTNKDKPVDLGGKYKNKWKKGFKVEIKNHRHLLDKFESSPKKSIINKTLANRYDWE